MRNALWVKRNEKNAHDEYFVERGNEDFLRFTYYGSRFTIFLDFQDQLPKHGNLFWGFTELREFRFDLIFQVGRVSHSI